ncbi:MAG: DUF6794 domain-containing protein, partial [Bacteroidota bacterium]
MKKLLCCAFLFCFSSSIFAQSKEQKQTAEERYQWRIQQSELYGTYIPRDLTDAFLELNRLIPADAKKKFEKASEEAVAKKLHFSLGQWMMVNWGFYEGSRLTAFMNKLGLYHPDDMARFLIISFHRSLNKAPLEVKALIGELVEKRENIKRERLEQGDILEETTRQSAQPQIDSLKQGKDG